MVFSTKVKEMVKILDEKKAKDIVVLDVSGSTIMADYFIICTGNSNVQVRRLAEELEDEMSKQGTSWYKAEGLNEGRWVVADYGDVLVHVFHREEREFYDIERLWKTADNYEEIKSED